MALNANKVSYGSNSKRPEVLEVGNYPARVSQVLDMGLQPQRPYQGQEKPPAYELMITYELGTEFLKDDDGNDDETKPRWVSETFPMFSLKSEKAKSTKRYLSLDPQVKFKGDFSQLVGAPCLVAIVNNENKTTGVVYNNVGGVTLPIKGMAVPELVNPSRVFDMDDPDMEVFNALPEWIQGRMKENLEFAGSKLSKLLGHDSGDEQTEPDVEPDTSIDSDDVPY